METNNHTKLIKSDKVYKEPDTSNAMIFVAATCVEYSRDLTTLCRAAGGQIEKGTNTPQTRYLYQYWRRQEIPKEEVLKHCQDGRDWVLGEFVIQNLKTGCRRKGVVLSKAIASIRVHVADETKNITGAFDLATDEGWSSFKEKANRFETASSFELARLPDALKNYEPGQNDLADWLKKQPPEMIASILEVFTLSIAYNPDPTLEINHMEPGTEKQVPQAIFDMEPEYEERIGTDDTQNTKRTHRTSVRLPKWAIAAAVAAILVTGIAIGSTAVIRYISTRAQMMEVVQIEGPEAAARQTAENPSNPEHLYTEGYGKLVNNQHKEARSLFIEAKKAGGQIEAKASLMLGVSYRDTGNYDLSTGSLHFAASFFKAESSEVSYAISMTELSRTYDYFDPFLAKRFLREAEIAYDNLNEENWLEYGQHLYAAQYQICLTDGKARDLLEISEKRLALTKDTNLDRANALSDYALALAFSGETIKAEPIS